VFGSKDGDGRMLGETPNSDIKCLFVEPFLKLLIKNSHFSKGAKANVVQAVVTLTVELGPVIALDTTFAAGM
jgi:hypothetical protein